MRTNNTPCFRTITVFLLASGIALAQTAPPTTGSWRRAGDAPPAADPNAPATPPAPAAAMPGNPNQPATTDAYGQPITVPAPPPAVTDQDAGSPPQGFQQAPPPAAKPAYGVPAQLTVKPGTFATIRVNEMLASNKSKAGDLFTGTLVQPIVVDGVIVAARGSAIVGDVAEAGKDKDGVHRLRLELTGITLADGTQASLQSKLVTTRGRTTPGGVEAGTVAGTTAVGAGIGAAVGWGTGAAIGAGAGAVAGLAGVLATRNHPSVVYPESMLTFEISAPVLVSTANAPQAFRYVGPEDYARPQTQPMMRAVRPGLGPRPAPYPYYYPAYPAYGPYYGYGYGYPYWGPGFGVVIGRGWGRRW